MNSSCSSREHYQTLLAPVYTWMAGGTEAALEHNRRRLGDLGLQSLAPGVAIDLGCGPGFQSIPLAEMGFDVVAIDSSSELLSELRAQAGSLPIRSVQGELRRFREHVNGSARLVVCMGDTLTHLESRADVERLVTDAAATLGRGGRLVFSFRDYTNELHGAERLISVHSDEDRILTCLLEYGPDLVDVTDLVHERGVTGGWEMRASTYRKLRLGSVFVHGLLERARMQVERDELEDGVITIVAVRPTRG